MLAALADAGRPWKAIDVIPCGAAGAGLTGIPITNLDNASVSDSSALRLACRDLDSGAADIALTVGVGKFGRTLQVDGGLGAPEPGPRNTAGARSGQCKVH